MREIANTIERDIARALKPKPEKIQEDYWTIYEKDCFGSYHSHKDFMSFGSYEDAESFHPFHVSRHRHIPARCGQIR